MCSALRRELQLRYYIFLPLSFLLIQSFLYYSNLITFLVFSCPLFPYLSSFCHPAFQAVVLLQSARSHAFPPTIVLFCIYLFIKHIIYFLSCFLLLLCSCIYFPASPCPTPVGTFSRKVSRQYSTDYYTLPSLLPIFQSYWLAPRY